VPSLVKIQAQWFWRRSQKCTSLQTDGRTDVKTDGRRTTGDQKNSLELSAQTGELKMMTTYILSIHHYGSVGFIPQRYV
jgi:hypothetical protein